MSERTTIGGTVYESIGSSSSNLLLKCNGTARIQWGSKLIDLIKNGKIVSDKQDLIFTVSDETSIKSDGIYIIDNDDNLQIWVCKNNKKYNLTESDLYISTNSKQDITGKQKSQALENIGLYYNTLEDLKQANLEHGIAYVISTDTLYIIKNGIVHDFFAELSSISVEQNYNQGKVINDTLKITLSIGDKTYITLTGKCILIEQSIEIKNGCQLFSKTSKSGYNLYTLEDTSYLDIDVINVKKQINYPNIQNNSEFKSGMIIMFNGNITDNIPDGWAICDGKEHVYNNTTITTPNLTSLFIEDVNETSIVEGLNLETRYSLIYIIKM